MHYMPNDTALEHMFLVHSYGSMTPLKDRVWKHERVCDIWVIAPEVCTTAKTMHISFVKIGQQHNKI